jgi:hypothetical protein
MNVNTLKLPLAKKLGGDVYTMAEMNVAESMNLIYNPRCPSLHHGYSLSPDVNAATTAEFSSLLQTEEGYSVTDADAIAAGVADLMSVYLNPMTGKLVSAPKLGYATMDADTLPSRPLLPNHPVQQVLALLWQPYMDKTTTFMKTEGANRTEVDAALAAWSIDFANSVAAADIPTLLAPLGKVYTSADPRKLAFGYIKILHTVTTVEFGTVNTDFWLLPNEVVDDGHNGYVIEINASATSNVATAKTRPRVNGTGTITRQLVITASTYDTHRVKFEPAGASHLAAAYWEYPYTYSTDDGSVELHAFIDDYLDALPYDRLLVNKVASWYEETRGVAVIPTAHPQGQFFEWMSSHIANSKTSTVAELAQTGNATPTNGVKSSAACWLLVGRFSGALRDLAFSSLADITKVASTYFDDGTDRWLFELSSMRAEVSHVASSSALSTIIADGTSMADNYDAIALEPSSTVTELAAEDRTSLENTGFVMAAYGPAPQTLFTWANSVFPVMSILGDAYSPSTSFVGKKENGDLLTFDEGVALAMATSPTERLSGFVQIIPYNKIQTDATRLITVTVDVGGSIDSTDPVGLDSNYVVATYAMSPENITWAETPALTTYFTDSGMVSADDEQRQEWIREVFFDGVVRPKDEDSKALHAIVGEAYINRFAVWSAPSVAAALAPAVIPIEYASPDLVTMFASTGVMSASSKKTLPAVANFWNRVIVPV